MTGIICAMEVELEKIRAMMDPIEGEFEYSSVKYYLGKISGKGVVCAVCGVGKVFAAICAQTMILKFHPDEIINVGVAGSLTSELDIGDLVMARQLVQHDMDVTALGEPKGKILGSDVLYIDTDEGIRDKLISCAFGLNADGRTVKALQGTIASGDQFITKKFQKQLITEEFGAIACEMEGAAIAQVCYVNKLPFCVLRAISDSADDKSHMDYPKFTKIASQNTAEIIQKYMAM
ncbi:MAG: 5'-methylthioadenosine/adenosylhomocysteine nucleosidase [Lachnospiraceae bacterium]|nr:5'-methylthioadenosine/adenosylhomocysteine nucleosidase [Lachnospiraceae bacterium]